jgi:hypothetical protein
MDGSFPVDLRVCGIGLRFLPPDPVTLGDDLRPFLTHGTADPDETFQIRLLEQPLRGSSFSFGGWNFIKYAYELGM